MAINRITPSKQEIYTKLMDVAGNYTDIKNSDFLKTGLFGYMTESMAMAIRDSAYQKSMLYNESFLNTAVIPQSVYNWAKMFNIEVQKATPAYADIDIKITYDEDGNNPQASPADALKFTSISESMIKRYGQFVATQLGTTSSGGTNTKPYLILNKEDPILAGDFYFSLEHSILIYAGDSENLSKITATYIPTEYESTNYQTINNNKLICYTENGSIIIKTRAYQYRRSVQTKQIVSSSFINKVQTFEFEDQFCGAKLFYIENGEDHEVKLQYTDLTEKSDKEIAYYNLTNEHELQLIFKNGDGLFMPSANSILKLYIYTTKGGNVPTMYSGDGVFLFSNTLQKALPIIVQFNPTDIIGGKNAPTLSKIKDTIIKEISTRKTITTQADLNSYFDIVTSLVESINDGKVKFIKQRDDVLRRMYNAYLLLRDKSNEDGTAAASNYISACVPTNTIDIKLPNVSTSTTLSKTFLAVSNSGIELSEDEITNNKDGYYVCPFCMTLSQEPTVRMKYIYNLTDQTSGLSYSSDTASDSNFSASHYMIPIEAKIYRGLDSGFKAEEQYILRLSFTTDFDLTSGSDSALGFNGQIIIKGSTSSIAIKAENLKTPSNNGSFIESIPSDDGTYKTVFSLMLRTGDNEFANADYSNSITLKNDEDASGQFSSAEVLTFDFTSFSIENTVVPFKFVTDDKMVFFYQLDTIMDSEIERSPRDKTTITVDGTDVEYVLSYDITVKEVPVVHSSFFTDSALFTEARKEGFISQLFVYINLLKEKLEKLETSTFFNLKFYNTYGAASQKYYTTASTNLDLVLEITLVPSRQGETALENEIRSYIRRIVDMMNKDGNGIRVSNIITLLGQSSTYGQYIDHINFVSLNNGLDQYIAPINDSEKLGYPPEWLNLPISTLEKNIIFNND